MNPRRTNDRTNSATRISSKQFMYNPRQNLTSRRILRGLAAILWLWIPFEATAASKTVWNVPYFYGADSPVKGHNEVRPPKFSMGFSSKDGYSFENMKWSGWGSAKAVGIGRLRQCHDNVCEGKGARVRIESPWYPWRLSILE
jgi:hypothetical protein